jgi:ABC-type glutathione transport system ATPase component
MDMSMAGPIGTEDLVKDYLLGTEVVHALQGVSVTIQAGEMGTIMGASGYGKSTLMTILGCLDTLAESVDNIWSNHRVSGRRRQTVDRRGSTGAAARRPAENTERSEPAERHHRAERPARRWTKVY